MQHCRRRFTAAQVRGADLNRGSAEAECRSDTGRIGDAAGRDHRHPDRGDDLRQQGEGAALKRQVVRQEVTAVATGFEPLRDDRVDAAPLEPESFGDGRRAGDDAGAAASRPRQQRLAWQAEVEADDGRPELVEQVGGVGVERRPTRAGGDGRGVDAELAVVRRQCVAPTCIALRIDAVHLVAEEVDVERPVGAGPQRREFVPERVGRKHCGRQRADGAGIGDGDRHRAQLDAGHRRLDERQLRAEERVAAHGDAAARVS